MGDVWQGPGPVAECEDYTHVLETCLGERNAAAMSKAVRERASSKDPEARSRAATECSTGTARMKRSCS
jgi:hypothetical protein